MGGPKMGRSLSFFRSGVVKCVWHERFVVLNVAHDQKEAAALVYYEEPFDPSSYWRPTTKSKLAFPLFGATLDEPSKRGVGVLGKRMPLSFELKPSAGAPPGLKPLVFAAKSESVKDAWVRALRKAINPCGTTPPRKATRRKTGVRLATLPGNFNLFGGKVSARKDAPVDLPSGEDANSSEVPALRTKPGFRRQTETLLAETLLNPMDGVDEWSPDSGRSSDENVEAATGRGAQAFAAPAQNVSEDESPPVWLVTRR